MAPGARPSPGPGRAPRLIANPWARVPIGSGTCRPRPLTCPAARPPSGRLAASPGPPPAELPRTTWWGLFGKRGRLRSRGTIRNHSYCQCLPAPFFILVGEGERRAGKMRIWEKPTAPQLHLVYAPVRRVYIGVYLPAGSGLNLLGWGTGSRTRHPGWRGLR